MLARSENAQPLHQSHPVPSPLQLKNPQPCRQARSQLRVHSAPRRTDLQSCRCVPSSAPRARLASHEPRGLCMWPHGKHQVRPVPEQPVLCPHPLSETRVGASTTTGGADASICCVMQYDGVSAGLPRRRHACVNSDLHHSDAFVWHAWFPCTRERSRHPHSIAASGCQGPERGLSIERSERT